MSISDLFEKKMSPLCENEGIQFRRCTEYHFQIKGIFTVNVYPTNSCYYIQGTQKKRFYESLDQVISLSLGESDINHSEKKVKRKSLSHKKEYLWNKSNECFVCGIAMESIETATIEHKIPLSKGGTNQNDNLSLSHKECNQKRGSSLSTNRTENQGNVNE